MIICHCRNISDQDYDTDLALYRRLCESDRDCCSCIQYMVKKQKNLTPTLRCCINTFADEEAT